MGSSFEEEMRKSNHPFLLLFKKNPHPRIRPLIFRERGKERASDRNIDVREITSVGCVLLTPDGVLNPQPR